MRLLTSTASVWSIRFNNVQEIGDARRRRRQRFGVGVGHAYLHSEAGEFPRGGETDAAGGACDDRDASRGESGMGHGQSYGSGQSYGLPG